MFCFIFFCVFMCVQKQKQVTNPERRVHNLVYDFSGTLSNSALTQVIQGPETCPFSYAGWTVSSRDPPVPVPWAVITNISACLAHFSGTDTEGWAQVHPSAQQTLLQPTSPPSSLGCSLHKIFSVFFLLKEVLPWGRDASKGRTHWQKFPETHRNSTAPTERTFILKFPLCFHTIL